MTIFIKYISIYVLLTICVHYSFGQIVTAVDLELLSDTNAPGTIALRSAFTNRKIVALGESTHQVGTTFMVKAKLIKYLHEQMGYNVILFESGMYDCFKAEQYLQSGDTSVKNLLDALFGIWWNTETQETLRYIISTRKTAHPIHFGGFDNQFMYKYSNQSFAQDIGQALDSINVIDASPLQVDSMFWKSLKKQIRYSNSFEKLPINDTLALSRVLLPAIESLDDSKKAKRIHNAMFWKSQMVNIVSDYRKLYFPKLALRDSIMAVNLQWIADSVYTQDKLIVWCATAHSAYNTNLVNNKYYQNKSMGSYLKSTYGDRYYSLAFTPNMGWGGYSMKWPFRYRIKAAKKGSIECYAAEKCFCDYAFISCNNDNKNEIERIWKSKIFWRKETKMPLFKIVDGVFYIKNMNIPTYRVLQKITNK
ncbi:MAG: erythromycin esterase family protein [Bacteroidetes bacterium]|nr:erythromycin esterase family protein [Bacteroidota bacterium]